MRRWGTPVALALLVVIALVLRLRSLDAAGMLDLDEARLTLAAQGIAEHGWPVFPTGKVYTRGLLQSLLMAPSLALLEPLELAARLPSMVAGVALVLVVFLYGRQVAGSGAGLFAATLVVTAVPLIAQSREAWFYSIFTLCWLVALLLLDRAVATGSFRALLAGATVVGLTFLAHEFAISLLPGFGLALLCWRAECQPLRARLGPLVLAALLAGLGLAVLTAFSLTLRADTVGGTLSEINGLLRFRLDLQGPAMYAAAFLPGWTAWLLGPGVLSAGLRSSGYAKYVREDGQLRRDIHTNAVLLMHQEQLRELLLVPYRGRTAWVIAWRSPPQWEILLSTKLRAALEKRAKQRLDVGFWTLYQLPL
jgi:4-amino-4-deoxy-L-arabinose transferase-like glycosyltransferase